MKRIIIILFLLLSASVTFSQIIFKNNHNAEVYVAMCRYVSSGKYWMTTGWYTIGKGGERLVFESISPNDTIGYWAMTTISEERFDGTKNLIVNDDSKFTIKNADLEETAAQNVNYSWRKFILLNLPKGTVKGTITLK
jgi:hypothetical protein